MIQPERNAVDVTMQLLAGTGKTLEELADTFIADSGENVLADESSGLSKMWHLLCSEPIGFSDAAHPQFAGKHEEAGETDQSECSDTNSESAERAQAEVERVLQSRERLKLIASKANVDAMKRHRRTKTLHFLHVDDSQKTACGREMCPNYDKFIGDPDKAWPHCKNCWGNLNP